MPKDFVFLDPGKLVDGDLDLVLVAKCPAQPERGFVPAYKFEMRRTGEGTKMGEIGLKIGKLPDYIGHIRYRVFPEFRGNRYAARACKLLISLARRHGINPIWITCRPDNTASRRTCEIIGAKLVGIVDLPEDAEQYQQGIRSKCRYRLDI